MYTLHNTLSFLSENRLSGPRTKNTRLLSGVTFIQMGDEEDPEQDNHNGEKWRDLANTLEIELIRPPGKADEEG